MERLLEDPTSFDEDELAPPLILAGPAWLNVRSELLSAAGLRSAGDILMGTPIAIAAEYARRPHQLAGFLQ